MKRPESGKTNIHVQKTKRKKWTRMQKKTNTQTTDRHIMLIWNLVEQWEWPITEWLVDVVIEIFVWIFVRFISCFSVVLVSAILFICLPPQLVLWSRYLSEMALIFTGKWHFMAWMNGRDLTSPLNCKNPFIEKLLKLKIENWNSSNNKTSWHFSRYSISDKQKQSLNPASDAPFYGVVYVRWEQSKAKLTLIYCIAEIQTTLMFSSQLIEWLMQIWSPEMKRFEAHFSDVFIWSCSSSLKCWCYKKWFYCFHRAAVLCRKINTAIIYNKCFIRTI